MSVGPFVVLFGSHTNNKERRGRVSWSVGQAYAVQGWHIHWMVMGDYRGAVCCKQQQQRQREGKGNYILTRTKTRTDGGDERRSNGRTFERPKENCGNASRAFPFV